MHRVHAVCIAFPVKCKSLALQTCTVVDSPGLSHFKEPQAMLLFIACHGRLNLHVNYNPEEWHAKQG